MDVNPRLTEENISKILNHSDFESGSEISNNDFFFIPRRDDHENYSESSSQSSFDEDHSVNLGCNWIEDNDESSEGDPNEVDELLPQHKKRKITIVPLPSLQRRQQKAAHLPDYGSKQARCRNPGCDNKTTVFCKKCNIFLCNVPNRKCFVDFHERNAN